MVEFTHAIIFVPHDLPVNENCNLKNMTGTDILYAILIPM